MMGDRNSPSLVSRLADSAISAILSAVVTAIAAATWGAVSGFELPWIVLFALAAAVAVGAAVALAIYFVRLHNQSLVSYPLQRHHFRVLEKKITYNLSEDGVLQFSRTIKLKALVDNLDRYQDKFLWTGGASAIPHAGENVRDVRKHDSHGIWTFYEAMFDHPLRRKEVISISMHWPPITTWATSSPFVSTSTEEPTDTIEFQVKIPPRFRKNDTVIVEEMRGIESMYPFFTEKHGFSDGIFTKTIKAGAYRYYRVRWEWAKSD